MATYMAFSKKVPLFGKRIPSTVVELISWTDVRASTFTDGATKLERTNTPAIVYIDLSIQVEDLDKLIESLNCEEGSHEDE